MKKNRERYKQKERIYYDVNYPSKRIRENPKRRPTMKMKLLLKSSEKKKEKTKKKSPNMDERGGGDVGECRDGRNEFFKKMGKY